MISWWWLLVAAAVGGAVVAFIAGAGRLEARAVEADLECAMQELAEAQMEIAKLRRQVAK